MAWEAADNFATIVGAIEEGRAIFANIRKFLTYILTSNVPEIVTRPWGNALIGTAPLPLAFWLFVTPLAAGLFALEELRKLIARHVIPSETFLARIGNWRGASRDKF